MNDMFFFIEEKEPVWRQYMDALGMTAAIEHLERAGYKSAWITKVFGPEDGATYHPHGGKFHKSKCPYYEGWWWAGGFGAVHCNAVDELLPGFVHDGLCSTKHEKCPFYKDSVKNKKGGIL